MSQSNLYYKVETMVLLEQLNPVLSMRNFYESNTLSIPRFCDLIRLTLIVAFGFIIPVYCSLGWTEYN